MMDQELPVRLFGTYRPQSKDGHETMRIGLRQFRKSGGIAAGCWSYHLWVRQAITRLS